MSGDLDENSASQSITNDNETVRVTRDADDAIGSQVLTVVGVVTLTVPPNTVRATFRADGPIRRTEDGSTPTANHGTEFDISEREEYDGDLTSLKFAAVKGTPTLTVYYFDF